LSEENLERV
jgi:DNA replication licensing factor MCM7